VARQLLVLALLSFQVVLAALSAARQMLAVVAARLVLAETVVTVVRPVRHPLQVAAVAALADIQQAMAARVMPVRRPLVVRAGTQATEQAAARVRHLLLMLLLARQAQGLVAVVASEAPPEVALTAARVPSGCRPQTARLLVRVAVVVAVWVLEVLAEAAHCMAVQGAVHQQARVATQAVRV